MLRLFQEIEHLFAALREGVVMEGIHGQVRRQIGELRACAGVGVGADDHRGRGRFEVE